MTGRAASSRCLAGRNSERNAPGDATPCVPHRDPRRGPLIRLLRLPVCTSGGHVVDSGPVISAPSTRSLLLVRRASLARPPGGGVGKLSGAGRLGGQDPNFRFGHRAARWGGSSSPVSLGARAVTATATSPRRAAFPVLRLPGRHRCAQPFRTLPVPAGRAAVLRTRCPECPVRSGPEFCCRGIRCCCDTPYCRQRGCCERPRHLRSLGWRGSVAGSRSSFGDVSPCVW
jgi:hypothetical protein